MTWKVRSTLWHRSTHQHFATFIRVKQVQINCGTAPQQPTIRVYSYIQYVFRSWSFMFTPRMLPFLYYLLIILYLLSWCQWWVWTSAGTLCPGSSRASWRWRWPCSSSRGSCSWVACCLTLIPVLCSRCCSYLDCLCLVSGKFALFDACKHNCFTQR